VLDERRSVLSRSIEAVEVHLTPCTPIADAARDRRVQAMALVFTHSIVRIAAGHARSRTTTGQATGRASEN
jgi:hypothetical protein